MPLTRERRRRLRRSIRTRAPGIVVVAVLGIALLLVALVPELIVSSGEASLAGRETVKSRIELANEVRGTWALVAIGILGVLALYVMLRRLEAQRQEGFTARFTHAIDQLGQIRGEPPNEQPNVEVRLGAIYALERIANDSERDHWQVMEVLTAYVRENARLRESPDADETDADPSSEPAPEERPASLRVDVQAALTVVGRRARWSDEPEGQRLDLRGANLRGVNLSGAHLERALLRHTHLENANLMVAQLEGADLMGAHLEGADLSGAGLETAYLFRAHLEGANLFGAHLERALLGHARLERARLMGAHMKGAYLADARLAGTNLIGAQGLTREQLAEARLDPLTKLPDYLIKPRKPSKPA